MREVKELIVELCSPMRVALLAILPVFVDIELVFVDATHEYENLSTKDWARVTHRIEELLKRNE